MADMQPPPPRYRIVERNGRLIVTDTWAENRPPRPEAPMVSMPGTPKRSSPATAGRPTGTGVPRLPAGGLIETLGAILVLGLCAGSTDSAGNPILTTANYYDVNGPRDIVLAPAGAKRLGRWLLGAVLAAMAMAVVMFATPWGFVVAFVLVGMIASNANTTARPAITRWLDALEKAG
jgi:hypothetical protein